MSWKDYRLWVTGLVVIICVIFIITSAFGLNSPKEKSPTSDVRHLEGLKESVSIHLDALDTPFITAQNREDLFFMQGYLSIENRPRQTLTQRALLAGELAAVYGNSSLDSDIHFRTLGLGELARRQAAALDEPTRAMFESYRAGLNAGLKDLADRTKGEIFHGFSLAPWSLEDVVINVYLPAIFSSSNLSIELLNQRLINAIGFDRARAFFPYTVNPDREPQALDYGQFPRDPAGGAALPLEGISFYLMGLVKDSPKVVSVAGSNNWAIAGEHTKSGAAILANDPHVDVRSLPNIYQAYGLATPEGRAVGVCVAGLPGLLIGRNEHVAFGLTLSFADNQDLYIEELHPSDPTLYRDGQDWVPFDVREEVIKIKQKIGPLREFVLPVRSTRRGVVVTREVITPTSAPRVLTLDWTVREEPPSYLGMGDWLFASDIATAREALLAQRFWYFNYLLGDRSGAIEHVLTGVLPVRSHPSAGLYPRRATAWDPDRPMIWGKELPLLSAKKGWLTTSNQDTRASGDSRAWLGSAYAPSYRTRRLHTLLEEAHKEGGTSEPLNSWGWLQDTCDLVGDRWALVFVSALEERGQTQMSQVLKAYDRKARARDAAPRLFALLWGEFVRETYVSALGEELAYYLLRESGVWADRLESLLASGDESLWLAGGGWQATLTRVVDRVAQVWNSDQVWGDGHFVRFVRGDETVLLPMNGSSYTPALAGYDITSGNFEVNIVQSLLMMADLGNPDTLIMVLPGGVREDVPLGNRRSQLAAWHKGEPLALPLSQTAVRKKAVREWHAFPLKKDGQP